MSLCNYPPAHKMHLFAPFISSYLKNNFDKLTLQAWGKSSYLLLQCQNIEVVQRHKQQSNTVCGRTGEAALQPPLLSKVPVAQVKLFLNIFNTV